MKKAFLVPAAAAALIATAAAPGSPAGALPPYPEALRCAGLTEAWTNQVELRSAKWNVRWGKAIFWGMAASEAARKAKVSGSRFTEDQKREAAAALAQLQAGDAGALAELAACVERVPVTGELGHLGPKRGAKAGA